MTVHTKNLVAGVVLSMLLHALFLIALRGRAPADLSVSDATRPSPIELTLRPSDTRKDEGQTKAKPTPRTHATKKLARKPPAPAVQEEPPSEPSHEKPAQPVIDLEAARRIAIETDRARERSLSESPAVDSPALTPSARLSRDIAKAVRPDCATAHAGKGLFAVIFLLKDAITDDGCKW
jgi:hypothetical protein